jgi:hypothetical protein
MAGFTLAIWNIEWCDRLVDALEEAQGDALAKAEARRDAIAAEIAALDADILVVTEGPRGEARAEAFFAAVAPHHRLVLRGDPDGKSYGTLGQQWIWFLIRDASGIEGSLLHIDRWNELTAAESLGHYDRRWNVAMPRFVKEDGTLRFDPERSHGHYRHPQLLLARLGDFRFEVIGAHLKSKHIGMSTPRAAGEPGFFKANPEFVAKVVEARAKLSTEATSIRHYIDARFRENAEFPVILAGDLNDGPGKERIEEQFLLHDLISVLQGEVFFARRFLNHALFDFGEDQRWTVQFDDRLDPRRAREILLDHVMFSQAFTGSARRGSAPFRAPPGGGFVAHEAHHAANAGLPRGLVTSDHRPVVMRFDARD